MAVVYIIQSETSGRYYVGCTENLLRRMTEHNEGRSTSTRGRGRWKLVHQEEYPTLAEGRNREREIKSWKSSRSIRELLDRAATG